MTYYERCLAVRRAVVGSPATTDRLKAFLRLHDAGLGQELRTDVKAGGRPGSNRTVYSIGTISVNGTMFYVAAKVAIPTESFAAVYMAYSPKARQFIAYETGAFEHLAEAGQKVPVFTLAFTYAYGEEEKFGLLTEDLTQGRRCRMEMINPDEGNRRDPVGEMIKKEVQVSPDGRRVEYWVDLKPGLVNEPAIIERGRKYLEKDVRIDLGPI